MKKASKYLSKVLDSHALPTEYFCKEPLKRPYSRVIKSLKITLDLQNQEKVIHLLKRISKVHHLTIQSNMPSVQLKRYFIKKSSLFIRIANLHSEKITLQMPDSMPNTYKTLNKYFTGYKVFKIDQNDPKYFSHGTLSIYGKKKNAQHVTAELMSLRAKLQADSLRLIPIFTNLSVLSLSMEMTYENLPSTDLYVLKNTIGKLPNLRKLEFVNIGASNIQTGTPLNDLCAMLDQSKSLEKLHLNIKLFDSEANIIRKFVTSLQGLENLEILELYVIIINAQFYNKSFQISTSNLPKLKKFVANASNLPEERLVLSSMKNFKSLIWLDLAVSIANRENYRALLSSIQSNKTLEILKLACKFSMSIPGTEDLAEILPSNQNLRKFEMRFYGKQYPPGRGLKRILTLFQQFGSLESFEFTSTKEFEIPTQSLQEILQLVGMLKKLKELTVGFRLTEKIEDKGGWIKKLILQDLVGSGLRSFSVEIKGLKIDQSDQNQIEDYCIQHNMNSFNISCTPSFL